MSNLSLKFRLMTVFTIFAIVIGSAASVVSWREAKESADEFFDTYQIALARNLASARWNEVDALVRKQTSKAMKHIRNGDEDDEALGFAVFNRQGKIVFHDGENGRKFKYNAQTGAFANEMVEGESWRIIRVKSADGEFIIAVGQEAEFRSDVAWDLLEEFMLPWIIGLSLLLVSILVVVVREFLPLKKIVAGVQNRLPDDLTLLPADNVPSEVLPLILAINGLLQKTGENVLREKRFVADAAHELRTPLTALKVQLEVLQMSGADEPGREKAVRNLFQGLSRSEHLVEQLLALSRLESSQPFESEKNDINWKKSVENIVAQYRFQAESKNMTFELCLSPEGPMATANPDLVSLAIKNLIENAVKYSPQNAIISIQTDRTAFKISNSGVRVDKVHLSKLSERFYRIPGQNEKGSGLGLSIVKRICDRYGCQLDFISEAETFAVLIKALVVH